MARTPELRKPIYDEEAFWGPWRPLGKGEIADPEHISQTKDGPIVPVRIYGVKAGEKGNGNGKVKTEKAAQPANPTIPNQGVIFGDTLIDPGSAILFVSDAAERMPGPAAVNIRTEAPRNAARPARPWGSYVVAGVQVKGPGRSRGIHLR